MTLPPEIRQQAIEALSDRAHASWAGWMRYLFSKSERQADGTRVIPAALVERWERQARTPYAELSEPEKGSDRDEARLNLDAVLPVIAGHFQNHWADVVDASRTFRAKAEAALSDALAERDTFEDHRAKLLLENHQMRVERDALVRLVRWLWKFMGDCWEMSLVRQQVPDDIRATLDRALSEESNG